MLLCLAKTGEEVGRVKDAHDHNCEKDHGTVENEEQGLVLHKGAAPTCR